jgi:hypothetical protein
MPDVCITYVSAAFTNLISDDATGIHAIISNPADEK